MVKIMDGSSVMAGKSKSDRCRSNYPVCVTAMPTMVIVYNASLENEAHQKYEQHGNPRRMLTHRKISGVGRTFTGNHDCYSLKMADLFYGTIHQTLLLIW
jgi:hypothetical protein